MGRAKGTPKTGGRQKGTPNRNTAVIKDCITGVLSDYMQGTPAKKGQQDAADYMPTLQDDLRNMLPAERVRAVAQLAGYVIPKQQAISVEEQTQIEADALTQWLETAPDDAINAIAAKVLELQARNREAAHAS